MTDNCFDEGTLQAFLDGELSSDLLENVARHVALCDLCAQMLQETEEESVFAFAALDNEFNTLVPTERIRTNLYQAISEIERPRSSFWQKLLSFGTIFSNPSVAAFAALIIVAGVGLLVWDFNKQPVNKNQAGITPPTPINQTAEIIPTSPKAGAEQVNNSIGDQEIASTSKGEFKPTVQNISYKLPSRNSRVPYTKSGEKVAPVETISGEETYINTIATLTDTVNTQKDEALRPSARVAFEKDLAIANDTITKMKKEVHKNPKNEAAKQVLRNSYQNKIDLLNSVTEKNELMATLK